MENKVNNLQQPLALGLACALAATLAVNGIQALLGLAAFAWWHLFTLAFLMMVYASSLTARQRSRIAAFIRLTRRKAAGLTANSPFSNISGRAAASRPFYHRRPQTEP
ncbi:MAG: hypothetical protein J6O51_00990 [Bacteroidales bacterium]|nr:hypothetical protein [Bacteroidales bacterium]